MWLVYSRLPRIQVRILALGFYPKQRAPTREPRRWACFHGPDVNERATKLNIAFRIEAPHRTEVVSSIENNLTIVGLDGPVKANTTAGNISISYVIKEVSAQSGTGDLED